MEEQRTRQVMLDWMKTNGYGRAESILPNSKRGGDIIHLGQRLKGVAQKQEGW